jgi:ABC-type polysaccharide/polyol phosphate transport system ATPase subunit
LNVGTFEGSNVATFRTLKKDFMATAVIAAEGLGKRYVRGTVEARGMLRDSIMRFARNPVAALRRSKQETFWALKDVSLEVKEGEVLGLIGRNGAGKTTLLKILSRITRPTTGHAEIRGHVRSLLEVGTGFHGELTGRENTYFSGSLLGMKKREIDRKLDEIIAFAEIEKFIDTPVKHYSSGMYVRLAFAVAAHLEPEILLVDEVLAVGDINFQKKCLGKMGDVARAGRTVVLVSHQMNQMRRLCDRVVWVDGGAIRVIGAAHEVVSAYESAMSRGADLRSAESRSRQRAHFVGWEFANQEVEQPHILSTVGPVTLKISAESTEEIDRVTHGIALYNNDRQLIWGTAQYGLSLSPGRNEFSYEFSSLPLRPGPYSWLLSLFEEHEELDMWDAVPEMIVATESFQHPSDEWCGTLNLPARFSLTSPAKATASSNGSGLT